MYNQDALIAFLISKPFVSLGRPSKAVAAHFSISSATASKWLDRISDTGVLSCKFDSATCTYTYTKTTNPMSVDDLNAEARALKAAGVVNIKTLRKQRELKNKFSRV